MELHYSYYFDKVTDGWGPVRFVKEHTKQEHRFSVGIQDAQFGQLPYGQLPSSLADMIDIALAVYIADRYTPHRAAVPCFIDVHLPMRTLNHYQQSQIQEALAELLYFMTRDHWRFIFTQRNGEGRTAERQIPLFPINSDAPEVALWSGGLDSLAGLYRQLHDACDDRPFTLFGTGGNYFIHSVQSKVFHRLSHLLPTISSIPQGAQRLRLVQVPLLVRGTSQLTPNFQVRARGFVFLLLGAACALMENQTSLKVYENGIGAINLPYRASEIGIDHSRAVHPRTIRTMGKLVTLLTGYPFAIRNPFEWQTKAQMCTSLLADHLTDPIALSITCDRRYRAVPIQCGRCSSCLLRRQALIFNGFEEPRERYFTTAYPKKIRPTIHGLHLRAMLEQVYILKSVLTQPSPWIVLAQTFPDLSVIADEVADEDNVSLQQIQEQIIQLYSRYCNEWELVTPIIGRHLLAERDQRSA